MLRTHGISGSKVNPKLPPTELAMVRFLFSPKFRNVLFSQSSIVEIPNRNTFWDDKISIPHRVFNVAAEGRTSNLFFKVVLCRALLILIPSTWIPKGSRTHCVPRSQRYKNCIIIPLRSSNIRRYYACVIGTHHCNTRRSLESAGPARKIMLELLRVRFTSVIAGRNVCEALLGPMSKENNLDE